MNKQSKLLLKGTAVIERRKKDGTVIDRDLINNLIVDVGKERAAKLLGGVSTNYFSFIGIGTSSTAPATSQTALLAQVTREGCTNSYEASFKAIFEKTFEFATEYTITEAGIFSLATGGVMLDRFIFSGKSVDEDTDLYIKVIITVA